MILFSPHSTVLCWLFELFWLRSDWYRSTCFNEFDWSLIFPVFIVFDLKVWVIEFISQINFKLIFSHYLCSKLLSLHIFRSWCNIPSIFQFRPNNQDCSLSTDSWCGSCSNVQNELIQSLSLNAVKLTWNDNCYSR